MGPVYEEAFRWHLVHEANAGRLGDKIVAIGPWWRSDGQDQIDAVALAEPQRTRIPVLAGEVKWSKKVNGTRIRAELARKAAGITDDVLGLRYAVCAREEVTHADPGLHVHGRRHLHMTRSRERAALGAAGTTRSSFVIISACVRAA
jgi:hypothetical protein